MKTLFICKDTVTGIFSAIYDAWKMCLENKEAGIVIKGDNEQVLFCEYAETVEREQKVRAVEKLIKNHLGMEIYRSIYYAMLSCDPKKGDSILGTMWAARDISDSSKIMNHLSNRDVYKVFVLNRKVAHEAHLFTGFVRFKELENKVLFAEIEPNNQILTCIADHFTNRLPKENWMIYDKNHKVFLVHQTLKQWVLVEHQDFDESESQRYSKKEIQVEELWKGFCKSISIEGRKNIKSQKNHIPQNIRQNMSEFQ